MHNTKMFKISLKVLLVLYLVLFTAPLVCADKPGFLTGDGSAVESKANDLIEAIIDWTSTLCIGVGALSITVGGIMLAPFFGRQHNAKPYFLGGGGAIFIGVLGLTLVNWIYSKIAI